MIQYEGVTKTHIWIIQSFFLSQIYQLINCNVSLNLFEKCVKKMSSYKYSFETGTILIIIFIMLLVLVVSTYNYCFHLPISYEGFVQVWILKQALGQERTNKYSTRLITSWPTFRCYETLVKASSMKLVKMTWVEYYYDIHSAICDRKHTDNHPQVKFTKDTNPLPTTNMYVSFFSLFK